MFLALMEAFPEKPTGWRARSDDSGYLLAGRGNGMMPVMLASQNASVLAPTMVLGISTMRLARVKAQRAAQAEEKITAPTVDVRKQRPCVTNLRMVDSAKEQWALETDAKRGTTPEWKDVLPYIPGEGKPVCPQGGAYTIRPLGEPPVCSHPGHQLP